MVREVDADASRLQVDALVPGGPHEMSLGFDEVEWA